MNIRRFTLLLTAALVGCAGYMNGLGAPPLRTMVEVEDDPFESSVVFRGVELTPDGNNWHTYFLRSFLDRETGEASHQVYVTYSYGGDWRFYERANGEGATPLEFIPIDRDVGCTGGCTYYEHFAVELPDALLRQRIGAGYALRAYAKSGHDLTLTLSPLQIREQLREIDNWLATHR